MNINMTLTCNTCEQEIDCRIGISNRKIQPLSFACPHCTSLICYTIPDKGKQQIMGARQDESKQYGLFDGRNPFVDLHLDFPVWFNSYVPGMTPFLVAVSKIDGKEQAKHQLMSIHTQRLNQLNELYEKSQEIRTILKLYSGKNKQLFKQRVGKFLDRSFSPSLLPEDVNLVLYNFISFVFRPFVHLEEVKGLVHDFHETVYFLSHQHHETFNAFMHQIIESNFLSAIQKDCLDLYPEIFDAELPLRPALYLDLLGGNEQNKVAARVSTSDFKLYKDLYKDIAEVFGRQLILVAGINNIIRRNDFNKFATPQNGKALSSLDKFADKTLSEKFKYLDDCWYVFDNTVVDTNIRNAISHFVAEYDEVSQIITYFPEKEGMRQEKSETMLFLEFMRLLLNLFREMHHLHHVIKALFYFEYLIRNKI